MGLFSSSKDDRHNLKGYSKADAKAAAARARNLEAKANKAARAKDFAKAAKLRNAAGREMGETRGSGLFF